MKFATPLLLSLLFSLITPLAFSREIEDVEEYRVALKDIEKSIDPSFLEEARDIITETPTYEAYEILKARLSSLPRETKLTKSPDFDNAVRLLVETFSNIGSQRDIEILENLREWVLKERGDQLVVRTIDGTIEVFKLHPDHERGDIISFEHILQTTETEGAQKTGKGVKPTRAASNRAHERTLMRVDAFEAFLSERVKDQAEVVREASNLFLKDIMRQGHRNKPEIFYLMGLPGNGRDTFAEAFVDAVNERPEAFEQKLFRLDVSDKYKATSIMGSPGGYVDSDSLSALAQFLVENSGGKYTIEYEEPKENSKEEVGRPYVAHNPHWNSQETFLFGPHRAAIFINEFHDIPYGVKNSILKEALDKGRFKIANPGDGPHAATEIVLPITFIIASNEGMDLLEPREKNGTRQGAPLSYEQLTANWERVYQDKDALKNAALSTNGQRNTSVSEDSKGNSPEIINRIPPSRLMILKPLSPKSLQEIAREVADNLAEELQSRKGPIGPYSFSINERVIRFIQEFNYIPSDNARPIIDQTTSVIFDPFYEAVRSRRVRSAHGMQQVLVDLKSYQNGAHAVEYTINNLSTGESYKFSRLLRSTLSQIPESPLSQQDIERILQTNEKFNSNVFGAEHIAERLTTAVLVSESESRNGQGFERPASIVALLGLTSTGKTEAAKQFTKALKGDQAEPVLIDFNNVRSIQAMEAKITGSYDDYGNPIKSEFMKEYDRANGDVVFLFDEIANAPREVLKALFEIFREPVAYSFVDGKPRPMKRVRIIMTGNAGEEIYDFIPDGLRGEMHERAMREIFQMFLRDEALQRDILTRTFPDALLARLGPNVFFMGPLTNSSKRQITQLKLSSGLKRILPTKSQAGWNIEFASEADLFKVFQMVEKEAYDHSHQGASIDKIVREQLFDNIKAKLLAEMVPSGSTVYLEVLDEVKETTLNDKRYNVRTLRLITSDERNIEFEVPVKHVGKPIEKSSVDRALTGVHEIGHELTSEVFMGDRKRPSYLSIINGITRIGSSYITYAGIRAGLYSGQIQWTREAILREVAELTGGYVAQQMVTFGGRHDDGKSNDIERATTLIQHAILRWGLSEQWGKRSIPTDITTADYIGNVLTEAERIKLNEITTDWLKRGEDLARMGLYANLDGAFVDLELDLNEKGKLSGSEIEEIYKKHKVYSEYSPDGYEERLQSIRQVIDLVDRALADSSQEFHKKFPFDVMKEGEAFGKAFNFLSRKTSSLSDILLKRMLTWNQLSDFQKLVARSYIGSKVNDPGRDARFIPGPWVSEKIVNLNDWISNERKIETDKVTEVDRFKIRPSDGTPETQAELKDHFLKELDKEAQGKAIRCKQLFTI